MITHPDVTKPVHTGPTYVNQGESIMWIKPAYTDMRFGFEVTMYVANR